MLYERYRGKGLGYSLRGVGIDAARPDDEDGKSLPQEAFPQMSTCAGLRCGFF